MVTFLLLLPRIHFVVVEEFVLLPDLDCRVNQYILLDSDLGGKPASEHLAAKPWLIVLGQDKELYQPRCADPWHRWLSPSLNSAFDFPSVDELRFNICVDSYLLKILLRPKASWKLNKTDSSAENNSLHHGKCVISPVFNVLQKRIVHYKFHFASFLLCL